MPTDRARLLRLLDELGIAHTTIEHPPVYTVEEAEQHTGHMPGGHCKNLFLKDRKGAVWLLVCLSRRRIDINRLARRSAERACRSAGRNCLSRSWGSAGAP
jgi:Ala-tRNA(Pro) deacylase